MKHLFILLAIVLCLAACGPKPENTLSTTFYHWQTTLAPDSTARSLLVQHGCEELFVKAFDVSLSGGRVATNARIELADTAGLPPLVPVVFITNEVFRQEAQAPDELAGDILELAESLLPAGFSELQIDCDWTAQTQVPYFDFLSAVKSLRPDLSLSCTVRLHQYRDREQQGVPPVLRATLMAYNTGDLNDWATENSILDSNIVKAYLVGQPAYPIDLDLAVAVYDWAAVYRRGELAYLINEPSLPDLADTARFEALPDLRYRVRRSTYLDGIYLYEDDLLRRELVPPVTMDAQRALLQRYVPGFPGQRLMVFRLGSRLWK
ncbi:hypothetical protein [Neolewinella agarilytica]|uniref:hypothetical protein n=1 Tax=Neolewinella agarilytica TaxID=478744 RepID=UPI0023551189|nr:hypothetical protein [Neolewinella agarilytica]